MLAPHYGRSRRHLAIVIGLTALLYLLAGTGMAYVAGFHAVYERLAHAEWQWLVPALGAVMAGFAGYYLAYRGIYTAEQGPRADARSLLSIVAAGFAGLMAHGAGAFDQLAMRANGADEREAKVRVTALAGFEHGALAVLVSPAAIAAMILGLSHPQAEFTLPWAIAPVPLFLLAAWAAERYRDRLRRRRRGLLAKLGIFLDAVHLAVLLFRRPRRTGYALLGMTIYWGADMFALWTTLAAFHVQMSALATIVALGTGMIVTRRTAPLGGAGVLMVALVATVSYVGAVPFAAATLGVAAYRFFTLWVPLPFSLLVLPVLRGLGEPESPPQPPPRGLRAPATVRS